MKKSLQTMARERVEDFKIEHYGAIGEPSNGALMLRLAEGYAYSRQEEKILKEHIQKIGYALDPDERSKAHVVIMALRREIGAEAR